MTSSPSDQLGSLYDPALGLTNLCDVLLGQAPEAAYSYVYLGQAQTLDQMFVNGPMQASLDQFRIAHINSDFPADYAADVARGTSDHDPNIGVFTLQFPFAGFFRPVSAAPKTNIAKAGQTIPVKFSLDGSRGLDIFANGPTATQVDCSDLLSTAPGSAAAGKLGYDAGADQYIYTWRTDKAWAGTCQRLAFTLTDGTSHEALFHFAR